MSPRKRTCFSSNRRAQGISSMEDTKSEDDDHHFDDTSDEFPSSDCLHISSLSHPSSPPSSPSPESKLIDFIPKSPPDTPSSAGLRRRRSFGLHCSLRETSSKDFSFGSSIDDEITRMNETTTSADFGFRNGKRKLSRDFDDHDQESVKLGLDSADQSGGERLIENEDSTVTAAGDDGIAAAGGEVSASVIENDGDESSFLVSLSGLVLKAIGYQFSLLISFITSPLWLAYCSYTFLLNPFQGLRRGKGYLIEMLLRICNVVLDLVNPLLSKWFKENKSLLQLITRCGWGLFWSVYVCSVLVSLLVSGFVVGGLMMWSVVEEPFRLKQALNFDYTKSNPVAFVPIMDCPTMACMNCVEKAVDGRAGAARVIPPNQKLKVTVELSLPESDYNRNLGMFQVRIDFLATNGKVLASSSHPCLLKFRSEPLRLMLTYFKIFPLIAGYASESQTLKLNFNGFTEGDVPTSCVKVIIAPRAEFRTGAGIPELYNAVLQVLSELPFLKRILWHWKMTIYIWLSMMVFMVELLFALVCCRTLLIPRVGSHSGVARYAASRPSN
ncbi:hypothetical protein Dimus_021926 [Dionaea muscipula]